MFYVPPIVKIRITKENIDQFYYKDDRTERPDYIADRKALEKKITDNENGIYDPLTEVYPERYDLNVLTYNQYVKLYLIIDGCHRIEAMQRLLKEGKVEGYDF